MTVAASGNEAVIRPLEERDAEAVTRILCEADDTRVLSPAAWLHRRRHRPEREHGVELGAELAGVLVGIGAGGLNAWTTTPGASWASVAVRASHRRRGIGSLLHERLLDHLRSVAGTNATSFVRWSEESERWARVRGWERVLGGPLIALDPRNVSEPSAAAGLRCVSMADVDDPRVVYEATCVAALDEPSAVPNDDIRYEDWLTEWDDPVFDRESSAVVLDGDRVVAFTYMNVSGDRAQHGFTGTLPEYRGRGLATLAKRRALATAARKGVTRVTTSNAEQNAAMRAINRNLGFEPIGEVVILSRDL